MKPLILLPTVHWRHESLAAMLEVLGKQTVAPWVRVIVDMTGIQQNGIHEDEVFDGHADEFAREHWPKGLVGEIVKGGGSRAQCARWWHVEQAAPDQIVMTLDDDLIIDEHYVERTLDAYNRIRDRMNEAAHYGGELQPEEFALSWGGVDRFYRWRHYYDVFDDACELVVPQTGLMCFRAGIWCGVGDTPAALHNYGHRRNGNEEVPLCVFAQEHGIRFFRPAGCIAKPHRLAFDDRSVSRTTQWNLRALLDWSVEHTSWKHAKAYRDLLDGKVPRP